jgi:DNA-binding MarR family transcriptional regulator
MAHHFDRALSTLSAKVALLESQGLLARQTDEHDGRRVLIWLSARGRAALDAALQVLDHPRLAHAGATLSAAQRQHLLGGLQALINALPALDASPHST